MTDIKKTAGLTGAQLSKIWEAIGHQGWEQLVKAHQPQGRFMTKSEGTLLGLCVHPDHPDTNPSFNIYTGKHYAKCFGCKKHTSNPIELYAIITSQTKDAAYKSIIEDYNIKGLPKKTTAEFEAMHLNTLAKTAVCRITHDYMCRAAGDPTNPKYAGAKESLEWLLQTRRIHIDTLPALPVGILPPLAEISIALEAEHNLLTKAWMNSPTTLQKPDNIAEAAVTYIEPAYRSSAKYAGGLVFPLHISPTEIGRIKIRVPQPGHQWLMIDDDYVEHHGIFGLGWELYGPLLHNAQGAGMRAYLVEGEMDALTTMSQYVLRGACEYPLISVGGGGGGSQLEDILKSSGISEALLIGDAPNEAGDKIVRVWLGDLKELNTYIFDGWKDLYPAKDFDEAVNTPSLGYDVLMKTLGNPANIAMPWRWVFDRAVIEMDQVDALDHRKLSDIAKAQGACLQNRKDHEYYAEELANKYTGRINAEVLIRDLASQVDDEYGYILRCEEAIRGILQIVGVRNVEGGSGKLLVTYNVQRREYHTICLDDASSIAQQLAQVEGTLHEFALKHLGIPSFITAEKGGDKLSNIDRKLRFYFREAVTNMARGIPTLNVDNLPKQGYHWFGEGQEYVVCGPDVFKIIRTGTGTDYTLLLVPRDGEIIFDVGYSGRAPEGWFGPKKRLTIEDLNFGKTVDVQQLQKDLFHLYDVGFVLKNHAETIPLLPLMIMSFPISDAFERTLLAFFTGESNSGKSSLLSTFYAFYRELLLLWSSHGSDNATEASMADECNYDTRAMIFDEFETGEDSARGKRAQNIMESVRGTVSGATERKRMGMAGHSVSKRLKMNVIFAAINTTEKPQDYNRLLVIETLKQVGRESSFICLKRAGFTPEKIYDIAYRLNTAMYAHAHEIQALYDTVRLELSTYAATIPLKSRLEPRYISSFVGMFAVAEFLGMDWKKIFLDFVTANQDMIERGARISESSMYLNAMLTNPVCEDRPNQRKYSVAMLLANPGQRLTINSYPNGIYYDDITEIMVVHLEPAISTLIPQHYRTARHLNSPVLKSILDRHHDAVPPDDLVKLGILDRMKNYLGTGIDPQDICGIRARDWITSTDVHAPRTVTTMDERELTDAERDLEATSDDV